MSNLLDDLRARAVDLRGRMKLPGHVQLMTDLIEVLDAVHHGRAKERERAAGIVASMLRHEYAVLVDEVIAAIRG